MKIGVVKESIANEKRVAIVPESVKRLIAKGFEVIVEKDAGKAANYLDKEYQDMGASIANSFSDTASKSDILLKVRHVNSQEADQLKDGSYLISFQDPVNQKDNVSKFEKKKINSFALEFIPRSSLAQSMDVLSSTGTIAGYKAVMIAANAQQKLFPMMMTAAGTIPPAKVLILGAGVAGLQAIATARKLGAVVEAFDTRPAVKEEVESLGGKFLEMPLEEDAQDDQGYAKEMSAEFIKKEMELIEKHIAKSDICISTAQVFGKKAPVLVKEYMVQKMRPGSVIVDLAAEQGGNCELSKPGETVDYNGVLIIGPQNIPSMMAEHASKMFSKNLENLLFHIVKDNQIDLNSEDEIIQRPLITKNGETVSQLLKDILNK
ncbi:MAG: Re/Si-specific NAD(P)(+) transhydrogenase subunit alpha [Spirochaetia bacterium]|nr:Re/Si-specific NAD(P)(+) transhydrogenase subunit alpha [Spirochaetia bacterium]